MTLFLFYLLGMLIMVCFVKWFNKHAETKADKIHPALIILSWIAIFFFTLGVIVAVIFIGLEKVSFEKLEKLSDYINPKKRFFDFLITNMKWEKGRQKATESVQKLKLFSGKTWDCYLLKIPAGSEVEPHFDKVEGKDHYRFNLTLWGFWEVFIKDYTPSKVPFFQSFFDYHLFSPDLQEHSAKIHKNTLLLSIGWAK